MDFSSEQMEIESEFKSHYSHLCGTCVGDPAETMFLDLKGGITLVLEARRQYVPHKRVY